ncbi:MAG: BsuPI-related putative proteinase inhibitor [Candidatus Woesearchaeota archaeon]
MKKIWFFTLAFVLILSFSKISLGEEIDIDDFDFEIKPEEITEDSYLPFEELRDEINIRKINLSEDRYLLNYDNDYFIVEVNSNVIESYSENLYLNNNILEVNDHLLLPVEFLTDVLGLDLEDDSEFKRPKPIVNNRLDLKLNVEENKVKNIVRVDLLLKNKSDNEKVLKFNNGQIYDFIIRDRYGSIVYKWSRGKYFSQAFREIELDEDESIMYDQALKINELKSGLYYLQGEIKSNNYDLTTKEIKLIIE